MNKDSTNLNEYQKQLYLNEKQWLYSFYLKFITKTYHPIKSIF